MNLPIPPGLTNEKFSHFLSECAKVVGHSSLLTDDSDRLAYRDAYRMVGEETHIPSAAVLAKDTAQVQALVKLANQYKVPVWPISRGKNLAYGGSAPHLSGSLVIDLSRMNRILHVDEELAYAELEPGVGFFDLHDYLTTNNVKLWGSYPEQCWGSVVGNAMDRGVGRTPYGDHSSNICGMEVVLPNGDLMRTGMGAMENSKTTALYKNGFGPGLDQLFVQSNLGIVTRMAMWLMPQPEATISLRIGAPDEEDLPWMLDTLIKLCRAGIIDQYFTLINFLPIASLYTERERWFEPGKRMRDEDVKRMLKAMHLGWWNAEVTLYGNQEIVRAKEKAIQKAFNANKKVFITRKEWDDSMPISESGMSKPTTEAFQFINWYGGRGGHMDFSPVLPAKTQEVVDYVKSSKRIVEEYGQDLQCALHIKMRHVVVINALRFNRDDELMTRQTKEAFAKLIDDAAEKGYGEYRTHLDWMDHVARSYNYNNNALLRFNERIKDAVDPNGIIAPGKSGIWPERYRGLKQ